MRRRRKRRSVGTVDSEERGPTAASSSAGVAGSGLSGAAGRLAAPLRGRHRARPLAQLRGCQARG